MLRKLLPPLPPQGQADDFHGSPGRGGGVVANLENFSCPAMRAIPSLLIPLCTLNFLFLNFCYPLPPPTAKPKIPMGNPWECRGWRWWQTKFHSGGGWRGTRNVLFRDNPTFVSLLMSISAGVGNAYFRHFQTFSEIKNGNASHAQLPREQRRFVQHIWVD